MKKSEAAIKANHIKAVHWCDRMLRGKQCLATNINTLIRMYLKSEEKKTLRSFSLYHKASSCPSLKLAGVDESPLRGDKTDELCKGIAQRRNMSQGEWRGWCWSALWMCVLIHVCSNIHTIIIALSSHLGNSLSSYFLCRKQAYTLQYIIE